MLVLDSVIHYLLSQSFQNDLQQLNINEVCVCREIACFAAVSDLLLLRKLTRKVSL